MVHGLGVSGASLLPLARLLARDRLVLVPDLPGFGRSHASRAWTTAELAGAVDRLCELRGLGRPVVVAHSYGCHVAVELAARRPGRAAALVLMGPAFHRGGRSSLEQAARLLADAPLEPPGLLLGATRDYWRAGPRRVVATLRDAMGIRLEDRLPAVGAPVLIMRGARDPLTPRRWVRELAARAGGPAAVAEVPRAPHALGYAAPRAVAAAVGAFLG